MRHEAPRLGALDLLRGAAVGAMIVVNNPGNWNAVLPPLTHASWDGLTFADVIFPVFIFVMGVALGLRPATNVSRQATLLRVLNRSTRLIGLGLLLNLAASRPAPLEMRFPGVLQRIGLTYLLAAPLTRTTSLGQWRWRAASCSSPGRCRRGSA
jgi:predicted acyltransferase